MHASGWHIHICIRWAGCWWAELQSCKVDRRRTDESTADSGLPAGESCAVNSLHGNNIPCRRRGGTPGKFTRQPSLDCSILPHVQWIDFLLKVAAALHFSVFACVLCSICNTVSSITVPQITARLDTLSAENNSLRNFCVKRLIVFSLLCCYSAWNEDENNCTSHACFCPLSLGMTTPLDYALFLRISPLPLFLTSLSENLTVIPKTVAQPQTFTSL